MRERGGGRRGGGKGRVWGDSSSASGMEAFIFPFSVGQQMRSEGGKNKAGESRGGGEEEVEGMKGRQAGKS